MHLPFSPEYLIAAAAMLLLLIAVVLVARRSRRRLPQTDDEAGLRIDVDSLPQLGPPAGQRQLGCKLHFVDHSKAGKQKGGSFARQRAEVWKAR